MSKKTRTLSESVDAVDEITIRLKRNLDDVIVNDALLRRLHDHPDIIPAFNNTVEGHGFGAIQRGLISLELLALVRCYDNQAQNRASLPHVMGLLKQSEIFDAVTVRARAWNPGMGFEDRNYKIAQQKVRFAMAEYERYTSTDSFRQWLTALRHHRDDHLAHSLFDMGEREKVLFGYIGDVMKETMPVVAALQLGVLGHDWEPAQSRHVWDRYADAFWRRTISHTA